MKLKLKTAEEIQRGTDVEFLKGRLAQWIEPDWSKWPGEFNAARTLLQNLFSIGSSQKIPPADMWILVAFYALAALEICQEDQNKLVGHHLAPLPFKKQKESERS